MARLAFLSAAHVHTGAFIDDIRRRGDGRRVAAVWDDEPDRGRHFAAHAGAPFVASLDEVLADPAVDGFVIMAENTRHLEFLRRVLPLGKPVFCEKPLVTSRADADALRALLRRHPTPLVPGYYHPFTAEMRAVAALLQSGGLGSVVRAGCRNAHHGAHARWFDAPDAAWMGQAAQTGGGGFLDMGTHALHLLLTLFGEVDAVWAHIRNESGRYPAIDDFGIAHLRFRSGVLATVQAGWTQTGGLNGLEVTGAARALWNTAAGYVTGGPEEAPQPLAGAFPEEPARIDRLVAVIRGQVPAAILTQEIETALRTVGVMEACYTASAAGSWITPSPA